MNWKYILIIVIAAVIVGGILWLLLKQPKVPESKFCKFDDDCILWMCAGCVNKKWAKTAPGDLPCATYAAYSGCKCIDNQCIEIK